MDDWTYNYRDVDMPSTRPALLYEDGPVPEASRPRAQQAEAARVAEFGQTQVLDGVGNHVEADVPLPFATPPSAALTF